MDIPIHMVTKPSPSSSTSGVESTTTTTIHSAAHQKVRSCQLKWLSSQVPRTSSRFT